MVALAGHFQVLLYSQPASQDAWLFTLLSVQLAGIEAVAMDKWEPYANSMRANLDAPRRRSPSTATA